MEAIIESTKKFWNHMIVKYLSYIPKYNLTIQSTMIFTILFISTIPEDTASMFWEVEL